MKRTGVRRHRTKREDRMKSILVLMVILAVSAPASFGQTIYAQGKPKKGEAATRSVQGAVTNSDDSPAVGAVVQLENTKTLQVRSFITQADGLFHFYALG